MEGIDFPAFRLALVIMRAKSLKPYSVSPESPNLYSVGLNSDGTFLMRKAMCEPATGSFAAILENDPETLGGSAREFAFLP